MHYNKKLNLLPQQYKDRYANKYLLLGFGGICAVLIFIILVAYVSAGMTSFDISRLQKENTEYQSKQKKIAELGENIARNKELISEYGKTYFPFYHFMQEIEFQKPYGLTLISIDSANRLDHEEPVSSPASQSMVTPSPSTKTTPEASRNDSAVEKPQKTVTYEHDLSGQKLVVRGYSANPGDIALFINNLSKLDYVENLELKAIEEHTINGTEKANIFEAELTLK